MGQMKRVRVLHCPETVGGNPPGLARAEREIGLDSWAVAFRSSPYGYKPDEVLWSDQDGSLTRELRRWRLLWRAFRDFDVVHFNFGRSIMPMRVFASPATRSVSSSLTWKAYDVYARMFELHDLPVLRKAGKGIVVTCQGDDARQGDFCLATFKLSHVPEVEPGYYSAKSDEQKRRRIAAFARYADRIYALNPDLLHVLPPHARFLPYSHIDLRDWRSPERNTAPRRPPVVAHSPSHRGVKGTRFVQDAVSRLKTEGVPMEFLLVEGVSNAQVRCMLERADLVVDQLLTGWYGAVAVEAMALAKPVVCYIRQDDLKFIPEEMRKDLPIINATPTTFYEILKEWVTARRQELPELGMRSRRYVEKWHDPLKIAAQLRSEYEKIIASK
jgi:hypothetical protein